MEVDGQLLTQSDAINRLVGKMANLYPEDNWQAALCDETMDTVDDATTLVVNTFFMEEDDKKRNRAELVAGPLPMFLSGLNKALEASGGDYFADGRLTMADLKVLIWVNGLISGNLDYIPTSIVADHGPQLLRHKALIESQLT